MAQEDRVTLVGMNAAEVACHARRKGVDVTQQQWKQSWSIVLEALSKWNKDNVPHLAAALSCYALLSIAPLGILLVAISGVMFNQQAASGQIVTSMGPVIGAEVARAIQSVIVNARASDTGLSSTALGLAVLLVGASGVFAELQSALNTIWKVEPKVKREAKAFVRHRVLAFAMVFGVALFLVLSLLVSAALAAVGTYFERYLPLGEITWQIVASAGWFALSTALFALVFRVVPEIEIEWKFAWTGALVTAFLFSIGKLLLGLYIGKSAITSSYGAAGSIVAIVVWVYYSSQTILLGAEFMEVYSRRSASHT